MPDRDQNKTNEGLVNHGTTASGGQDRDDDLPILHDQAVMGEHAKPPQGVEDLDLTNGPKGQSRENLGAADAE